MQKNRTLDFHLKEVLKGLSSKKGEFKGRRFENVFQAVTRMNLSEGFEKVKVNGKTMPDFNIFRQGKKPIVAMHEVINSFVGFVKDAAQGGSSRDMAFTLIGEPGNGKTYFIQTVSNLYRNFVSKKGNERFTLKFKNLDNLKGYGKFTEIQSQTFEDPMILAMNLFGSTENKRDENKKFLSEKGFSDQHISTLFENYRPLGADSDFILNEIREYACDDLKKIIEMIEVIPIPLSPTQGVLTGKYSAKDKTTSSSIELIGEEGLDRILNIANSMNPYRFDLGSGALAKSAGGGIHFADELFKNKVDLLNVYLTLIENRSIETKTFKWPMDILILATSNNSEYNLFKENTLQSPLVSRCRTVYVPHNTNYKLQRKLTKYALGDVNLKKTFLGKELHIDPCLINVISDIPIFTRYPELDNMTPEETRKLCAGEVAEDKSFKDLEDSVDKLNRNRDITKRFAQKGLNQRDIGKMFQLLNENPKTDEDGCMGAQEAFRAAEKVILDYVQDDKDQTKYLNDVKRAKIIYRQDITEMIFDAFMDEKDAIKSHVLRYVNMIVALGFDSSPDDLRTYPDPETGKAIPFKIKMDYVNSVESRLGLTDEGEKESFRTTIRKSYSANIQENKNYNFMDNGKLIKAVTEVRLESNVNGEGSLIGALSNRTNEENQEVYNRMLGTMIGKLKFCKSCAEKTMEYYCTKQDES